MTEDDWLTATDPQAMLEFLQGGGRASERRLRLFAAACCRRIWPWLTHVRSRKAVTVAEAFADDPARLSKLGQAHGRAWEVGIPYDAAPAAAYSAHIDSTVAAARASELARLTNTSKLAPECVFQCNILRDIFGNLFRPVAIDPACLTSTVTGLAQAPYDDRNMPSGELDTARLAVLSDALEETGCDDADILNHLRGPGPHIRGCWVLDLLLGKE